MAMPNNLLKRDGTYYARIYIPQDLQSAFDGKREKWQSLRTKELSEAKARLAAVLDEWASRFASMRQGKNLSGDEVGRAVFDHYSKTVERGDIERVPATEQEIWDAHEKATAERIEKQQQYGVGMHDFTNSMIDVYLLTNKTQIAADHRKRRLAKLKLDLGVGDTRLIEIEADKLIRENNFKVFKGSAEYRDLCLGLMRAEIEALNRTSEREAGDFTGVIKDPLIVEPVERPAPVEELTDTLMQLFDKYEKANPKKMQADSMKQVRRDVEHFAAFVGPRFQPQKIDRATVAAWMDLLYEYPVKASEIKAFRDMTPQEAVAANKAMQEPKPTLKVNTIRRYMSSLGGFCRWLKLRAVLTENPVSDMLPEKDTDNERLPFTDPQMKELLASPLFAGSAGDSWQEMAQPGTHQVRDHRYWVPLVMAYSGARPGEIAQLQTADVREHHGIWIMHITTLGDGDKRTKTKGSMRVVPVHSELINLGFVRHCQSMAKAGHKQVFPEVEIPKTGQIIPEFSREMNRTYLTRIGIKTGPEIVLYSLRHTFIDRLRRAGFMDDEIGVIVGHDKPTTTGRYGTEQQGTLKRRAELVETVRYS